MKSDTKKKSSLSCGVKIFLVLSAIPVLLGVYAYHVIMSPKEAPIVDREQWWGPLPRDPNQDLSVRPFKVQFTDAMVKDLKQRLQKTRPLHPPLEGAAFTYGFNSKYLNEVLDFWRTKYDFKQREQFLNKYPHFVTNIQGLDIHFMRATPKPVDGIKVLPLLLLHNWPSSVREFYEVLPLLTTPRPDRDFVFDVIVPSLPGFGYSQASDRPGLGIVEIAVIFDNLMTRLNISQYYTQDAGHVICSTMATLFQDRVLGFHTNIPVSLSAAVFVKTLIGAVWPSLVVEPEVYDRMYPLSEHYAFYLEEYGYLHIQSSKPDTVGVALTDSPAGLAAYTLEKFSTWTNRSFKFEDDGGLPKAFPITNLLDNVMIYWTSNCITTSMRIYSEYFCKKYFALDMDSVPTTVPTWGIRFKYEVGFSPDSLMRLKYLNYLNSTVIHHGGHFGALENPAILADDLFRAVKAFMDFHERKKLH